MMVSKSGLGYRWEIINCLIRITAAKEYLEIGWGKGVNFNQINCESKTVVEPNDKFLKPPFLSADAKVFHGKSDDFFEQNKNKFDTIFIDGLHRDYQVERDVINSLKFLNPEGYIICHDINPLREEIQRPEGSPPEIKSWTGDCWKAWVKLRQERPDLKMFVVNTDSGCGVITKGFQKPITLGKKYEDLEWEDLEKNREEWLNLIEVEDFYNAL